MLSWLGCLILLQFYRYLELCLRSYDTACVRMLGFAIGYQYCSMAEPESEVELESSKSKTSLSRKKLQSVRAVAIKKGVLVHEVDEGSPCLKCGSDCPGFSLHFWRKICKNCLCAREEHDVLHEEHSEEGLSVGKLLFSPSADTLTAGKKLESITASPR